MEATVAFRREPPRLVTVITVVHLIEMTVATVLMAFLVLPMIFHFSLLSSQFWQIYGRFYVTGLFGTFFYVALPGPYLPGGLSVGSEGTGRGGPGARSERLAKDAARRPATHISPWPPTPRERVCRAR